MHIYPGFPPSSRIEPCVCTYVGSTYVCIYDVYVIVCMHHHIEAMYAHSPMSDCPPNCNPYVQCEFYDGYTMCICKLLFKSVVHTYVHMYILTWFK